MDKIERENATPTGVKCGDSGLSCNYVHLDLSKEEGRNMLSNKRELYQNDSSVDNNHPGFFRDGRGGIGSFHLVFPEAEDHPAHGVSVIRDFFGSDGGLNLEHKFPSIGRFLTFLFSDRFHAILALRWSSLFGLIFIAVTNLAILLAGALFLVTGGDREACLGNSDSIFDYFFFVVETMFSIGFGSPRFPSCRASSLMVLPTALCGVLFNSVTLGLVFQKFSSASKRTWALAFSTQVVVCEQKVVEAVNGTDTFESGASAISPSSPNSSRSLRRNENRRFDDSLELQESSFTQRKRISDTRFKTNDLQPGQELQTPLLNVHVNDETESVDCPSTPCFDYKIGQRYPASLAPTEQPLVSNSTADWGYGISFRVLNMTETALFNPRLSLFLLIHSRRRLVIRQFPSFHTDTPLEFCALPITITVRKNDPGSPLRDLDVKYLQESSSHIEFVALLSFVDNRTSRPVEVSKSWRLNEALWNEKFVPIVRPTGPKSKRAFEVDVEKLSLTTPLFRFEK